MKDKCKCGETAVWHYAPSDADIHYCDECIPRGCYCNVDHNGIADRDAKGRLLPCCEYDYDGPE